MAPPREHGIDRFREQRQQYRLEGQPPSTGAGSNLPRRENYLGPQQDLEDDTSFGFIDPPPPPMIEPRESEMMQSQPQRQPFPERQQQHVDVRANHEDDFLAEPEDYLAPQQHVGTTATQPQPAFGSGAQSRQGRSCQ